MGDGSKTCGDMVAPSPILRDGSRGGGTSARLEFLLEPGWESVAVKEQSTVAKGRDASGDASPPVTDASRGKLGGESKVSVCAKQRNTGSGGTELAAGSQPVKKIEEAESPISGLGHQSPWVPVAVQPVQEEENEDQAKGQPKGVLFPLDRQDDKAEEPAGQPGHAQPVDEEIKTEMPVAAQIVTINGSLAAAEVTSGEARPDFNEMPAGKPGHAEPVEKFKEVALAANSVTAIGSRAAPAGVSGEPLYLL